MRNYQLTTLPIFNGISGEHLEKLDQIIDQYEVGKNTIIFQQGQAAVNLYILLCGEVIVRYKPHDGPQMTIANIAPGDVFGWSAILGKDTYTSEAIATIDCISYSIRSIQLQKLFIQHPDTAIILLDRIASGIAERLSNTYDNILSILLEGIDKTGKCASRIKQNGK